MENKSVKLKVVNNNGTTWIKGKFILYRESRDTNTPSAFIGYIKGSDTLYKFVVFFTLDKTEVKGNKIYLNKKDIYKTRLSRRDSDVIDVVGKEFKATIWKDEREERYKERLKSSSTYVKEALNKNYHDMTIDEIIEYGNKNASSGLFITNRGSDYLVTIVKPIDLGALSYNVSRIDFIKVDGIDIIKPRSKRGLMELLYANYNQSEDDFYSLLRASESYDHLNIEIQQKGVEAFLKIQYSEKYKRDLKYATAINKTILN